MSIAETIQLVLRVDSRWDGNKGEKRRLEMELGATDTSRDSGAGRSSLNIQSSSPRLRHTKGTLGISPTDLSGLFDLTNSRSMN
jgi:hypothetical protein